MKDILLLSNNDRYIYFYFFFHFGSHSEHRIFEMQNLRSKTWKARWGVLKRNLRVIFTLLNIWTSFQLWGLLLIVLNNFRNSIDKKTIRTTRRLHKFSGFGFFVRTHVCSLYNYLSINFFVVFFFYFVIVCLTHIVLYYLYHWWVWVPIIKFCIKKKSAWWLCTAVDYTSGVFFF